MSQRGPGVQHGESGYGSFWRNLRLMVSHRGQVALWAQHLPRNDLLDASTAAACCRSALTQSRADWRAEQCLFHKHQTLHVGEDWAASAWDDPWSLTADPRSAALDKAVAVPFGDSDFAVYGDGGYDGKKPTCSSQARSLGPAKAYW